MRSGAKRPEPLDLAVGADGRIAAVGTAIDVTAENVIDLGNKLVVPGLVDAHQHLDKSRTRRLADNPSATLEGASAAYRRLAAAATREDIIARASARSTSASAMEPLPFAATPTSNPRANCAGSKPWWSCVSAAASA